MQSFEEFRLIQYNRRRSVRMFSLTKNSFLRESRDDFFDAYSSFKAWKRSSRREPMRVNNAANELYKKNLQRWHNHVHLTHTIRTEPLTLMNLGRICHPIHSHHPSVHLLHYKHWCNGLIHCVQH